MKNELLLEYSQKLQRYHSDAQRFGGQMHGFAETQIMINPQAAELYNRAASSLTQNSYSAEQLLSKLGRLEQLKPDSEQYPAALHSFDKGMNAFSREFESTFQGLSMVQDDLTHLGANYGQIWQPLRETLDRQNFEISNISVDLKKQIQSDPTLKDYDPSKIPPTNEIANVLPEDKKKAFGDAELKVKNITPKNNNNLAMMKLAQMNQND